MIVHSYIYYELNDCIISDHDYDMKAKQLVKYKNDYPETWRHSEYYKQFGDDYNGSTGFTFYEDLNDHQQKIIQSVVNGIYNMGKEISNNG